MCLNIYPSDTPHSDRGHPHDQERPSLWIGRYYKCLQIKLFFAYRGTSPILSKSIVPQNSPPFNCILLHTQHIHQFCSAYCKLSIGVLHVCRELKKIIAEISVLMPIICKLHSIIVIEKSNNVLWLILVACTVLNQAIHGVEHGKPPSLTAIKQARYMHCFFNR